MATLNKITDLLLSTTCVLSNLVVRGGSYVFLRWIPGHLFPDQIATAYAIYVTSILTLYFRKPKYEVVARNTEVKLVEPDIPSMDPTAEAGRVGEDSVEAVAIQPDPPIAIEATETVVSRKKKPNALKSLALGTPEPNSLPLTLTNLLINTLLFLGTIDLTYTPGAFYSSKDLSFARIGYVSPNTAKILIREPDAEKLPLSIKYRIEPEEGEGSQIEYPWITSQDIPKLGPATDYSLPIEIHNLHPSTRYRFRTSNNHTGTFHTAPARITGLDRAMGHNTRHTKFTFLTSSCIKSRFPYNPIKHPLHMRGFKILGDLLKKGLLKADFMLFLGDFIYIDVPKRPKHNENHSLVEGYRERYRQVYASPEWPDVGQNLPWLHVIDDHEIANDWDKNVTGLYPYAMDPFYIYQHSVNPPPPRPGATYYIFNHGTASFFMMDSRRFRGDNFMPDGPDKSMLGKKQFDDLIKWLRTDDRDNGIQWKILSSSVPFTKNWHFGTQDTWGGYLHERRKILEEMWKVGAEGRGGVVILSGDRHEFGATAFPPPPGSNLPIHSTVHEFSCSPLSQFYLPRRTYKQTDDEDVMIKYIPDGNSKFGAIEIDSTNVAGDQGVLKYRLFVDGVEVWDWVLTAETGRKGGVGERELKEGGKKGERERWE